MASMSEMSDDGSKQSGGRRVQVLALTSFSSVIHQIASDLSSQCRITCTLPDGVKSAGLP